LEFQGNAFEVLQHLSFLRAQHTSAYVSIRIQLELQNNTFEVLQHLSFLRAVAGKCHAFQMLQQVSLSFS
jgi:hypothetical protein